LKQQRQSQLHAEPVLAVRVRQQPASQFATGLVVVNSWLQLHALQVRLELLVALVIALPRLPMQPKFYLVVTL
jgi:hypothetical protein